MELLARYYDGLTAAVENAIVHVEGAGPLQVAVIRSLGTRVEIGRWPAGEVVPLPGRAYELRVGCTGRPAGARLVFIGPQDVAAARTMLPALLRKHRQETGRQVRIAALATAALVSVLLAYVFGVPVIASRLVWLVPPLWEERLGETVAEQAKSAFASRGGFEICDPDPGSLANRALQRFATAAIEGSGSPFKPHIAVIRSEIPNAFSLPGGQVYYFSALLDGTENPDEMAGVLAHEIGHVVHRHGMEQLIGTAGTGALIGFILGDMTGISVAAGFGSALIDTRFSRDAELQADAYSASVARRLGFRASGLPDLLERVAQDNEFSRAVAMLSTHPLTSERRAELERLAVDQTNLQPPFSPAEWQAIKTMCASAASTGPAVAQPGAEPARAPASEPPPAPSAGPDAARPPKIKTKG